MGNTPSTKVRNSNIELLRVICMYMIIMHHYVVHGGSVGMEGVSLNRIITFFVAPFGKICINCFVAISTWFLVKSTFKASRFLKIWLQVLFFNLLMMFMTSIYCEDLNYSVGWRNFLGACFPIMGNSHGYASAYLAFYLTIPFLKMIGERVSKNQLVALIGIMLLTQIGSSLLGKITGYVQPHSSEILLFVMCYFISLFLQKYPIHWQNNKAILVAIIIVIWLMIVGLRIYDAIKPGSHFVYYMLYNACDSEFSIFNIIAGYALFLFFYNVKMPTMRAVNLFATTTFGVLLIHDSNYFRPILWLLFVRAQDKYYIDSAEFVGIMFLVSALIFMLGALVDFVRQYMLERSIVKSRFFCNLCNVIDSFFSEE